MPTTYEPNGALNQSRTSTLGGRSTKSRKTESTRPESSRVLFLLYLIHRTWNVMVDTVDSKNKRYVLAQLTRRWRINIHIFNLSGFNIIIFTVIGWPEHAVYEWIRPKSINIFCYVGSMKICVITRRSTTSPNSQIFVNISIPDHVPKCILVNDWCRNTTVSRLVELWSSSCGVISETIRSSLWLFLWKFIIILWKSTLINCI